MEKVLELANQALQINLMMNEVVNDMGPRYDILARQLARVLKQGKSLPAEERKAFLDMVK